MKWRGLTLFLLLSLVIACAPLGPNYQRSDPSLPSHFGSLEVGITSHKGPGREILSSWWEILQDPDLNFLINRAIQGNLDLRIAQARVQQARALGTVGYSRLFPEGGVGGTYERFRRAESSPSGTAIMSGPTTGSVLIKRQDDLFLVGFDASWEIDIFGGVRREIEAAEADSAASEEVLRDILVTLQGEVARNYIEYRGQQIRLEIVRQEIKIRRENVEITEARWRAGLVSQLDLARARGELASSESRIPLLEQLLAASLHHLGILLGFEPQGLKTQLQLPMPLPQVPENLPVGLPSDLLRRRPDIRRTERELAAATARVGVSTAELFPKFSLTGSFGFQTNAADQLFRHRSNFWGIGPTFNWPILNFKRILANIELTKAVREETLARYERTVLLALEEVENSLVVLSQEKRRIEALTEAVRSNELAVQLAMERYLAGLESYLAVTDAEAALYTAQDELAQSRQNYVLSFISLYKALGGGWLNTLGAEGQPSDERREGPL